MSRGRPDEIPPHLRTPADWEAIEEIDPAALDDLERRIARKVSRWEIGGPAVLVLESMKPVTYIASQALVVGGPLVQSLVEIRDYYTFRKLLENRDRVEELVQAIEAEEETRLGRAAARRARRGDSRALCRRYRAWLAGRGRRERGVRPGVAKQPRA